MLQQAIINNGIIWPTYIQLWHMRTKPICRDASPLIHLFCHVKIYVSALQTHGKVWILSVPSRKHLGKLHFLPSGSIQVLWRPLKRTQQPALPSVISVTRHQHQHWCCATSQPFEPSTSILLVRKDPTSFEHQALLRLQPQQSLITSAINQWGKNVLEILTFPKTSFCTFYTWSICKEAVKQ